MRDRDAAPEPVGPVRNGEIVPPEQGRRGGRTSTSTAIVLYSAPAEEMCTPLPRGFHRGREERRAGPRRMLLLEMGVTGMNALGPGPQEVSTVDRASGELRVLGYDGATRDTLNLRDAVAGEMPSSIAWSPDGSRLAVSTDCELPPTAACPARVWIMDRDGGNPTVVYSEPAPRGRVEGTSLKPLIRELTWSPDGNTLAFIVHSDNCGAAIDAGVRPRLVNLRVQSGRPPGAKTLHVYDDIDCHGDLFPVHYPSHFNYAWSPDGTRLAVTSGGGFERDLSHGRPGPGAAPDAPGAGRGLRDRPTRLATGTLTPRASSARHRRGGVMRAAADHRDGKTPYRPATD